MENDAFAKSLHQAVSAFYERHGAAFARTRGFEWEEERRVAALVRPTMTVTDVGAGNGRFARFLKDVRYIGIEPSSTLRKAADHLLDMRPGDVTDIPLHGISSDVTVCFAVLQHLATKAERTKAVDELVRITKDGGIVAATSWIPPARLERQAVEGGEKGDVWIQWKAEGASEKRYIHEFDEREWQELWTRKDLKVERMGMFGRKDWTEDEGEARNWFVVARKVS